MQRIDFFRLERPIQERFIAAAHGAAQPVPLAVQRDPLPPSVLVWSAAAALSVGALIALARAGYGNLESQLALHPPWMIAAYAFLAALAALCMRRVVAVFAARRALPYTPGIYVFPSGLIDTRRKEFLVRSLAELNQVSVKGKVLSLQFEDKSRFSFPLTTPEHARNAERALAEHRERLKAAVLSANSRELSLLDPLCDNGFKNLFSPTESMRPPAPRRFPIWTLAALFGAALAGFGVFSLRNHLGEQALYKEARMADTKAAYLAYTERGGTRPEVRGILLPRTELAEVVKTGTLGALESFASSRTDSKIATEIDIALQHALRKGLEDARRQGTLTALKTFREAHGKHPSIAPEVERSIEEYWKARLSAFEQSAQPKPSVRAFFRRLLSYTSKHGSRVEVRFRRRIPESVPRAEAMIKKSLYFGGEKSLPAQYFDTKHAEQREGPVGRELVAALNQAFPKDLVEFHLTSALEDSEEELPTFAVPTLLITHRTEMSGGYLLKNPRAALTGIGVLFRVAFQIPGDKEALHFRLSTWNAPDLKRAETFKGFEDVYEEMAFRAFSKLPKKYLADLLPGLEG